jgi:hypothetical protein
MDNRISVDQRVKVLYKALLNCIFVN